jgi:hypothetical protein
VNSDDREVIPEVSAELGNLSEYYCDKCDARFAIAGTSTGSDDDAAADDYFDSEVERHESGECSPAATYEATPACWVPWCHPQQHAGTVTPDHWDAGARVPVTGNHHRVRTGDWSAQAPQLGTGATWSVSEHENPAVWIHLEGPGSTEDSTIDEDAYLTLAEAVDFHRALGAAIEKVRQVTLVPGSPLGVTR